jgi:hypothetical protein
MRRADLTGLATVLPTLRDLAGDLARADTHLAHLEGLVEGRHGPARTVFARPTEAQLQAVAERRFRRMWKETLTGTFRKLARRSTASFAVRERGNRGQPQRRPRVRTSRRRAGSRGDPPREPEPEPPLVPAVTA